MELHPITAVGQVSRGDVLLIRGSDKAVIPAEVQQVLYAGTHKEEVVLSTARNVYFIVSMFLAGKSWVKECARLEHGRMVVPGTALELTGHVCEIGMLEGEGGAHGLVIKREHGHVTIKGLREDEVKKLTPHFCDEVVVRISPVSE